MAGRGTESLFYHWSLSQITTKKKIVTRSVEWELIAFRVRHSRGEMYSSHGRLRVCLSVCLSVCPSSHSHTTAQTGCNLGMVYGCPLVVQY